MACVTAATMGSGGVAVGCSPSFTPASLIEDERVIAVIATPPEAVPGQEVSLTPVVASPTGTLAAGVGFDAGWWRCPDSDSDALGDFWECTVPSDRVELGGGDPYVDTVPLDLFGEPPAPGEPPPDDVATERGLGALLGFWRVMGMTMTAGDRVVDSFKRVPVYLPVPLEQLDPRLGPIDVHVDESGALAPNTNPVINAVLVHDGALNGPTVATVKAGQTYFFAPIIDERQLEAFFSLKMDLAGLDLSNPEAFADADLDELLKRFRREQRCEVPTFNWYVSAGRVRREITLDESVVERVFDERGVDCPPVEGDIRTADTEFTAPTGEEGDSFPEDGVIHAWVVLRDGRGGTAVRSFDLNFEE
jgi:hypothetical protein